MLQNLFSGFFRDGALGVIRPDRAMEVYGKGEPEVIMRLHDRWAEWELALNPDLKLGELYMDRRLVAFHDDTAGNVTSWHWDFGDGSSSTEQNPLHTFAKPGSYVTILDVAGPDGKSRLSKVWDVQLR